MSQQSVNIASVRLQEMSQRVSTRLNEIHDKTGLFQFSYFLNNVVSLADTAQTVPDSVQTLGETELALDAGIQALWGDDSENAYTSGSSALDTLIAQKAEEYGVPAALVRAVIQCESGYDVQALSNKGAMGLMQLMPTTAEGLGVLSPFDPEENIDGGIRYLLAQIIRFDGDIQRGLAAYNCGPRGVTSRQITDLNDPDQFAALPGETQAYLQNIQTVLADMGYSDLLHTNFFSL